MTRSFPLPQQNQTKPSKKYKQPYPNHNRKIILTKIKTNSMTNWNSCSFVGSGQAVFVRVKISEWARGFESYQSYDNEQAACVFTILTRPTSAALTPVGCKCCLVAICVNEIIQQPPCTRSNLLLFVFPIDLLIADFAFISTSCDYRLWFCIDQAVQRLQFNKQISLFEMVRLVY